MSYLKYCYENGEIPDTNILRSTTFYVTDRQFYQTLQILTDDGYIKELIISPTKNGTLVTGLDNLAITSLGLQYLTENSMMKKAYKMFKEVKVWLPLI
ncbi:YjcQ family protein [Ligilactobacillus salivarius]|uniref:YjcQ family protein n=1 Tax=Ligilactobacillus salivarius TaxID=1624 RepID=UPI001F012DAF|nr:YjcQ family protein [Ligilactobacillus salivarius]